MCALFRAGAFDREWLAEQLATPEGIDRLESFGAKFSRLQDTLSDRLLPLFLRVLGELPGTAVENVNRAERLGIVRDIQEWLGARGLRNRLVHEYIDDLDALEASLDIARRFTTVLMEAAPPSAATRSRGSVYPRGETGRPDIGRSGDAPASKQA